MFRNPERSRKLSARAAPGCLGDAMGAADKVKVGAVLALVVGFVWLIGGMVSSSARGEDYWYEKCLSGRQELIDYGMDPGPPCQP